MAMSKAEAERTLSRIEQRLAAGNAVDLASAGFWRVVGAVKRNPSWAGDLAGRIAAVDRSGFERWAWITVPATVGTAVMALGTVTAMALISWGYYLDDPWNGLAMLAGFGIAAGTTHGLGHVVVGRLVGIRFTHWYIGEWRRPQPGVKIDYATYLRTPPRSRAWMHASGAIVTKLLPFIVLGSALVAGVPWWVSALLVAVGVVQIITDLTLSVKHGDWKKFRREMGYAG